MTQVVFASAGEEVKILSSSPDGVVIVETKKGERFFCMMDQLTEVTIVEEEKVIVVAEPLTKSKIITNQAPAKLKGHKAGATNTNLLF